MNGCSLLWLPTITPSCDFCDFARFFLFFCFGFFQHLPPIYYFAHLLWKKFCYLLLTPLIRNICEKFQLKVISQTRMLSNATVGALVRNVGPSENMIRLSFNMAAASHTCYRNEEFQNIYVNIFMSGLYLSS